MVNQIKRVMKELSIEEKARAYDEALKKARILVGYPTTQPFISDLQDLFPELEESEDEKMIQYFKDLAPFDKADELYEKYGFSHKDAIAWLEKQDGHAKFINGIQVGDKVTRNEDGVLVNLSQLKRVAKKDEKQGEQKPIDPETIIQQRVDALADIVAEQKPADKVEPKFHKGDWVVCVLTGSVYQIKFCIENLSIHKYGYDLTNGGYISSEQVNNFRLWDITKDAKDGDVLAAHECVVLFKEIAGLNIKCHCTYHFMNNPSFYVNTLQNKSAFHPATKEQRDLLFQKIKENGYEWDAEKKELKKIEQKPAEEYLFNIESELFHQLTQAQQGLWRKEIEQAYNAGADTQKPAWSEEDDDTIKFLISHFCTCHPARTFQFTTNNIITHDELLRKIRHLKYQNKWKPSDKQINALNYVVNLMASSERPTENDLYYNILKSLREQLKKLREE